MIIDKPKWHLKKACPDCNQGFPVFCKCKNCGYLTVFCEETGDTFLNPNDLGKGFTDICPDCNTSTSDFIYPEFEDITILGFLPSDFE
jgi:hypothetical protein